MNSDGFIKWALDDARTVEERYTTELLVEMGVSWWNSRHKIYKHESFEARMERKRKRDLNPAYEPCYSGEDVRKTAEMLPEIKDWSNYVSFGDRQIRDLKVFTFLPDLQTFSITNCEVADVEIFTQMPSLRSLGFASTKCEDLTPLSRCVQLRELSLTFGMDYGGRHTLWPDVSGLERLAQLDKLTLTGNLLAFARGVSWPRVRMGVLKCEPLPARTVRDLPQLPACEFLTLAGVERLDGIEAFPRLRNLKLETDARDFAPLTALDKLTCFTCSGFEPVDVSPLVRLPHLQVATFDARYQFTLTPVKPRDFSVFAEAPALRELHVLNCPPVEAEVKMVNNLLARWNDELLAAQPRPLPPAPRMIVALWQKCPQDNSVKLDPADGGLPDNGLRECEGRWVGCFVENAITIRLGAADWGTAAGNGVNRQLFVTIESFAVVEKLPEIIEAMREVIARLRHDYTATLMIALKSPQPEPTPAQVELEKQFRDEQEEADWERRQQEQKEYLERLHRYELKKQLGAKIKPEEFVPPPPAPLPDPPWEGDEEDDELSWGDVAVKKKPDPPPSWLDDEHPLADHYRLMAHLTLSEVWFMPHHRDIAVYLMGREPDMEIPEETKAE